LNSTHSFNVYNKDMRERASKTQDDKQQKKVLLDYYANFQNETHGQENKLASSSSVTVTSTITPSQHHLTQEVLQQPSTSTSTVRSYKSQQSAYSDRPSSEQSFSISKLPSKRQAILTGSRALIKRIGKNPTSDVVDDSDTSLPLCYLLSEPVELEDVTISSTEGMNNHILVCLHREVVNMFKFIYNLRSPNIKPDELQDIVLLCSRKPSHKVFELINTFPKVYFMEVSCWQHYKFRFVQSVLTNYFI
jgi:hypothetical protein